MNWQNLERLIGRLPFDTVTIDPGEPVKEHTIIIKCHIKKERDPAFKCEGTSIPLVEEVELLGVTVDDKFEVRKSN